MLRTSSRLAPSLTTNRPCDLPVKKTRDASDRRLPPNRTACTRTSCVPDSSRHFRSGDDPRSPGLRAAVRGTGRFTTSETASADRHSTRLPRAHVLESRAWASSSHGAGCDRASDTPVAGHRSPSRLSHLRGSCNLAVRSSRGGVVRVGGCGGPPRPPSTPLREKRRFVMIRDAFRQRGLFLGSGGHYSPGPATASPSRDDASTAG